MKTFQADQIKNIALLGNSGSSKEEVLSKEIIQSLTIALLSMKTETQSFRQSFIPNFRIRK